MQLISQGGLVMWPLLALSVIATTLIVERWLLLGRCAFPDASFDADIQQAINSGNMLVLAQKLSTSPPLRDFAALLLDTEHKRLETALRCAGEAALSQFERHLGLLSLIVRIAPLLGLLGTILGMITTFEHIAAAQSGVNMEALAIGIWQALITTATGLSIAIPAMLALHLMRAKVQRIRTALTQVGNTALEAHQQGCARTHVLTKGSVVDA